MILMIVSSQSRRNATEREDMARRYWVCTVLIEGESLRYRAGGSKF